MQNITCRANLFKVQIKVYFITVGYCYRKEEEVFQERMNKLTSKSKYKYIDITENNQSFLN